MTPSPDTLKAAREALEHLVVYVSMYDAALATRLEGAVLPAFAQLARQQPLVEAAQVYAGVFAHFLAAKDKWERQERDTYPALGKLGEAARAFAQQHQALREEEGK